MSEPRAAIDRTELPLPLVGRGKVRDIYAVGDEQLLMVASDRISAFDVVLSPPIPDKGAVLTQLTAWWLARVGDLSPHHLITAAADQILAELPTLEPSFPTWAGRAMLVRRTEPIPVECVVRGYIAGSAWREYRDSGTLAGEALPVGLVESQRLPQPIFSPATKADEGHDENITFGQVRERVGWTMAEMLRERSMALYRKGQVIAGAAELVLADTKFEFGRLPGGEILLIDEVLTPDSSRFWPRESYSPGQSQPSLDKQPVRDYLETLADRGEWDKTPPAPELPAEVVEATSARYRGLFERLTGYRLEDFPSADPGAPPRRDRKRGGA